MLSVTIQNVGMPNVVMLNFVMLTGIVLSVIFDFCYCAECCHAERRYAECTGTLQPTMFK
jgi:hypothetical protein